MGPSTQIPRATKGILVGILTGVVALTGVGAPEAPMTGVIVRGADLDAVAAAVAAHGGTVELEIGLIDAVSADVPVDLVDDLDRDSRTLEVSADAQVQLLSLTDGALLDTTLVTTDTVLEPVLEEATALVRGMTGRAAADLLSDGRMTKEGFDGTGIDVAIVDSGVATGAVADVEHAVDLSFTTSGRRDGYGHGTAMAGIIRDVAPDAGIIDVKVADDRGVVDVSQVLAGIDWVVSNRATNGRNIRVLSLSFGTDGTNPASSSPMVYAVEAAWRHGITTVVAAGNHGADLGRLTTPAISPWVIAVGAADIHGLSLNSLDTVPVPTWSAVGDGTRNPDVLAPGRSILGGLATDSAVALANPDAIVDGRIVGSGTSQAAAFTAGVVAALHEARPGTSPDEAKALLLQAAKANSTTAARQAGHGLIDLDKLFGRAHLTGRVKGTQRHKWSDGTGTLDGDRGRFIIEDANGNRLTGQNTPVGPFNGSTWTGSTWTGSTWTGSTWTGSTWTGSTWTGSTWTGSTWTGSTWTGSTWTGSTWTGSTWTSVRWGQ